MSNYVMYWLETVSGDVVRSDMIVGYIAPLKNIHTEPVRGIETRCVFENGEEVEVSKTLQPIEFICTVHCIIRKADDLSLPLIITQEMIHNVPELRGIPDYQTIVESITKRGN